MTWAQATPLTPTSSIGSPTRIDHKGGWNEAFPHVILSEAKDLTRWATRFFASLRMTVNGLRMALDGRFVSPRPMS